MNYPKVAIIVVHYNGKDNTLECLDSLRMIDYPNFETIVIDNASTDGASEIIQKRFPEVNLICLKKNTGYGAACNIGIKASLDKGDIEYVYLSNNDVIFDKNFMNELVKVAENDGKIGVVGPIVYLYDRPNVIQSFGGNLNLKTGNITHFRSSRVDTNPTKEIRETDFIIGGFLLIKKDVINKVGLFDTDYFMYGEEVDYEYRTKQAGYKLAVVPTAKVWHKVYGSYGGKLSPDAVFYMARNQVYFMRKHMSALVLTYFFLYLLIYRVPRTILAYIKNQQIHLVWPYFRGILTGIANKVIKNLD